MRQWAAVAMAGATGRDGCGCIARGPAGDSSSANAKSGRTGHAPTTRLAAMYVGGVVWNPLPIVWNDDVVGPHDAGPHCGGDADQCRRGPVGPGGSRVRAVARGLRVIWAVAGASAGRPDARPGADDYRGNADPVDAACCFGLVRSETGWARCPAL